MIKNSAQTFLGPEGTSNQIVAEKWQMRKSVGVTKSPLHTMQGAGLSFSIIGKMPRSLAKERLAIL